MNGRELENPHDDYYPALDEMVQVMGQVTAEALDDDCTTDDWAERHEVLDQTIRESITTPERRHCFKCQRWVSFGLGDPEGEDPRCPVCTWQVCVCGACGCKYSGRVG